MRDSCNSLSAASLFARLTRFSLRSLLVVMTVISVTLAWYVQRVRSEQRAAEAVAAAGGKFYYDWQMRPENAPHHFQPDPPGPNCLRTWFGAHWFDNIARVELNGFGKRNAKIGFRRFAPLLTQLSSFRELRLWLVELDHADYEALSRMPRLQVLSIGQVAEMTPADAAALARSKELRGLRLDYAKVAPQTLSELAKLANLETLEIDCNSYDRKTGRRIEQYELRNDAAKVIATFPRLRTLMVFCTQITDEGMANISKLSKLETLVVSSHGVTSASFEEVAKLRHLRHLGTWAWKIDDGDFVKLSEMRRLTSLAFVTPLTDESVVQLCKLKQVRQLMLDGEKITDKSLPHLRQLPNLQWLYMRDTGIDKLSAASKQFVQAMADCAIALPPTEREKEMERSFIAHKWGGTGVTVRTISNKSKLDMKPDAGSADTRERK